MQNARPPCRAFSCPSRGTEACPRKINGLQGRIQNLLGFRGLSNPRRKALLDRARSGRVSGRTWSIHRHQRRAALPGQGPKRRLSRCRFNLLSAPPRMPCRSAMRRERSLQSLGGSPTEDLQAECSECWLGAHTVYPNFMLRALAARHLLQLLKIRYRNAA